MQPSYPLVGPPSKSGIYILKNKSTGHLYVGQSADLRRRYGEWRSIFSTGFGTTNPALRSAVESTNIEDWEFVVFELCERENLNHIEREVIRKVQAAIGVKCINGIGSTPTNIVCPERSPSVRLSRVLDEEGKPMSYAQIAARCGVNRESVKKRLSKWRHKGKTEFHITELI